MIVKQLSTMLCQQTLQCPAESRLFSFFLIHIVTEKQKLTSQGLTLVCFIHWKFGIGQVFLWCAPAACSCIQMRLCSLQEVLISAFLRMKGFIKCPHPF